MENAELRRLSLIASGQDVYSNMALLDIEIDGKVWPSTEHYFQAMKFDDDDYREKIRLEPNPYRAAVMGGTRKYSIRKDWDDLRVDVMRQALAAKVSQHPRVQEILAGSKGKIIDYTASGSFWGIGDDGNGTNMVGVLLMELRDALTDCQ